jgi:hypothetical protein
MATLFERDIPEHLLDVSSAAQKRRLSTIAAVNACAHVDDSSAGESPVRRKGFVPLVRERS